MRRGAVVQSGDLPNLNPSALDTLLDDVKEPTATPAPPAAPAPATTSAPPAPSATPAAAAPAPSATPATPTKPPHLAPDGLEGVVV